MTAAWSCCAAAAEPRHRCATMHPHRGPTPGTGAGMTAVRSPQAGDPVVQRIDGPTSSSALRRGLRLQHVNQLAGGAHVLQGEHSRHQFVSPATSDDRCHQGDELLGDGVIA